MSGAAIRVTAARHRIGRTVVADPVVHHRGRELRVTDSLPAALLRLVPHAWGNAAPEAWRPFVREAAARGML